MKTNLIKILAIVLAITLSSCAQATQTAMPIAAATEAPIAEYSVPAATEAPAKDMPIAVATQAVAASDAELEAGLLPTVAVPAPYNGMDNYFQDYGVNAPVKTSRDHLSTFGLDVDTASYEITSTYIEDGSLPPMDAVRAEEFINAFNQGYDNSDDAAFTLYADGGPSPFIEEGNYLIRFGVQGYSVPDTERKPLNLTFVIDVSGSMADGNRLELVKDSLKLLVDQLDERDTITIVAFSNDANLVLRPTSGDEQRTIIRAIKSLYPLNSTNADAGLSLGYKYASRMLDPDAVNRIILCSDGVANTGDTSVDSMLDYVQVYADQGITLTGIGVGMGNYNDVLLEQLADNGDGNYYYVNDRDEAEDVFVRNMISTMQVIAYDAKIQIDFNPEVVETYRLIGYENRQIADEDFRDDTVDAGEIGAGMTTTALYEIQLHKGAKGLIATAQLRWQDAETSEPVEIAGDFYTGDLSRSFESTSPYFQLASTVAAYAEILRVSPYVEGSLDDVADEAERISRILSEESQVREFAELARRTVKVERWQD